MTEIKITVKYSLAQMKKEYQKYYATTKKVTKKDLANWLSEGAEIFIETIPTRKSNF